jgi:hypothetical protein
MDDCGRSDEAVGWVAMEAFEVNRFGSEFKSLR